MRRFGRTALILLVAFLIAGLGGARDEGDDLSQKIADAAQRLALSNDDEAVIFYAPASGVDQTYWVAVGAGPRCPHLPCPWSDKSWLAVHTEGRDSGISYSYQRYVAVPRPIKVIKNNERAEVVLRKNGDEIELTDIR